MNYYLKYLKYKDAYLQLKNKGGYINPNPFSANLNIKNNVTIDSNIKIKHTEKDNIISSIDGFELIKSKDDKTRKIIYPTEFNYYVPISNFDKIMASNKVDNYMLVNQKNYIIIQKEDFIAGKTQIFKLLNDYSIGKYDSDIKNIIADNFKNKLYKNIFFTRKNTFKVNGYKISDKFDVFSILYIIREKIPYIIRQTFLNERLREFMDKLFIPTEDFMPTINNNIVNKLIFGGELNEFLNILIKIKTNDLKKQNETFIPDFYRELLKLLNYENTKETKEIKETKEEKKDNFNEQDKKKIKNVITAIDNNILKDFIGTYKSVLKDPKKNIQYYYDYLIKNADEPKIKGTNINVKDLLTKEAFSYILNKLSDNKIIDLNECENDYEYLNIIFKNYNDVAKYGNLNNVIDVISDVNKFMTKCTDNRECNENLIKGISKEITKSINKNYYRFVFDILIFIKECLYVRTKYQAIYYFDIVMILTYFIKRLEQSSNKYPINKREQMDNMINGDVMTDIDLNVNDSFYEYFDTYMDFVSKINKYTFIDDNDNYLNGIYNEAKKFADANSINTEDYRKYKEIFNNIIPFIKKKYKNTEYEYNDVFDKIWTVYKYYHKYIEDLKNKKIYTYDNQEDYEYINMTTRNFFEYLNTFKYENMDKYINESLYNTKDNKYSFDIIPIRSFEYNNVSITDCGETLMMNIVNSLLFNSKNKIYDNTYLPVTRKESINDFYKNYNTSQKQNSSDAHNQWGLLVSNIDNVKYNREKHEIIPTFSNIFRAIYTLFGFDTKIFDQDINEKSNISTYNYIFNNLLDNVLKYDDKYKNEMKKFTIIDDKIDSNSYITLTTIKMIYNFTNLHGSTSSIRNNNTDDVFLYLTEKYVNLIDRNDDIYNMDIYNNITIPFQTHILANSLYNFNNFFYKNRKEFVPNRTNEKLIFKYQMSDFTNHFENYLLIMILLRFNLEPYKIYAVPFIKDNINDIFAIYNITKITNLFNDVIFIDDDFKYLVYNYVSNIISNIQKFTEPYNKTITSIQEAEKTLQLHIKFIDDKLADPKEQKKIDFFKKHVTNYKNIYKDKTDDEIKYIVKTNLLRSVYKYDIDKLENIIKQKNNFTIDFSNTLTRIKNMTTDKYIVTATKPIIDELIIILLHNDVYYIKEFIDDYYSFSIIKDNKIKCNFDLTKINNISTYTDFVNKLLHEKDSKENAYNCDLSFINSENAFYFINEDTKYLRESLEKNSKLIEYINNLIKI